MRHPQSSSAHQIALIEGDIDRAVEARKYGSKLTAAAEQRE
jgi:hypothetical protein